MKKALYIIASIFEVALLIGAYIINYFTHKKMGMARYVVYKNREWEDKYPIELLQYVAIAVVLILTAAVVVRYVRLKEKRSVRMTAAAAATILLDVIYIGFTFISGTDTLRAYYFIGGMFAAAAFVQVAKTLVSLFWLPENAGNEEKEIIPEKKKPKKTGKIVLLIIAVLAILAYMFIPAVNAIVNSVVKMFSSGDFTVVREFVASYGAYAAIVSFLLMIFQSVAAPLPAFLITFANANLFGWWKGAILSWSSAMAGAALCFFIARILGRDVVEKLTSKAGLKQIDDFFEKHGRMSILIARLLPFISFDIVSYAAGLTSMSFGSFFVATGIGQLPATIIYSYVGGMLTGGAKMFVTALMLLFALSALVVLVRQVYMERQKKE